MFLVAQFLFMTRSLPETTDSEFLSKFSSVFCILLMRLESEFGRKCLTISGTTASRGKQIAREI